MPVYKNVTKRVYFQSLLTTGADNTATTPTVKIVRDGGAQATATNTPSHLGTGQWMLVLTATEMNADEVSVNHSASGCVSGVVTVYPEADYTSVRAALISNVDVASSTLATASAQTLIKAKTDQFTFTTANKVDSTIQAAADLAQAAADKVWSTTSRVLTAGTNIALAKGTGVTGFNDITAAAASTAVWDEPTATSRTAGSYGALVKLDLDATVSSRSTYAGADTVGTTTLLTRIGTPAASVSADVAAVKADTASAVTKATDIQGRLPATLVSGRIDASVGAMAAGVQTTSSYAPAALDATVFASSAEQAIADKTLATTVEGTLTLKQALQVIAAATAGKVTGGGTTTITMRNTADSVNAIVATVDANGNRSALTYTFT